MRRTFLLWLVLRIIVLGSGAALGGPRIAITPFGFLCLTALTCALMLLDARATGEDILTANAGVSRFQVTAVSIVSVGVLEAIVLLALS